MYIEYSIFIWGLSYFVVAKVQPCYKRCANLITSSPYLHQVRVTDAASPNYVDVANVTVGVADDNDHAPELVAPPPGAARALALPFNVSVGSVLTQVKVSRRLVNIVV